MKPIVLLVAAAAFSVTAPVIYLIVRNIDTGMAFLGLVIGALVGTQAGVYMHHRQPGTKLTGRVKLTLGITLAVTCSVAAWVMQSVWHCFEYLDVTLPIGAVGSFVFPFVVAGNFWNALEKMKSKGAGKS